jgi:hypothetical protein
MPYEHNENFTTPADDVVIWRYMDFTKYVSMLHKHALYFGQASVMWDKFEGSLSKPSLRMLDRNFYPPMHLTDAQFDALVDDNKDFRKALPHNTRINCWYMGTDESAGMWQQYLQGREGIAIKSTVAKLRESLVNTTSSIYIGEVKYIDYSKGDVDFLNHHLNPFFYKRLSFSHENEVRAVIEHFDYTWDQNCARGKFTPSPAGKFEPNVHCDLKTLIGEIYVAPQMHEWFRELVSGLAEKYELDKKVHQSNLDIDPVL